MNDNFETFIEKMVRKEQEEQNIKNEILLNNDYINWIEEFLTKNNIVCMADDMFAYNSDSISKEDLYKTNNIYVFVNICIDYANNNLIAYDNGIVYVKHNKTIYGVEIVVGQGAYSFIKKQEHSFVKNTSCEIIEWEDIRNNKKHKDFEIKKDMLDKLQKNIESCILEHNISPKYITNIVNETIKEC